MAYKIKELFYSFQGEGAHAGRPAIFCRFAGCNLWTGREEDRATAICQFCDTDFWGMDGTYGGKYSADGLADQIMALWPGRPGEAEMASPYIIMTGGEPALQIDDELIQVLHQRGAIIAIETNGTLELPAGIDWICVSPKANTDIVVRSGDELKLVFPQINCHPEQFAHLDFKHFSLQPMDGPMIKQHTASVIAYCLEHPQWRVSLQTHKYAGVR